MPGLLELQCSLYRKRIKKKASYLNNDSCVKKLKFESFGYKSETKYNTKNNPKISLRIF